MKCQILSEIEYQLLTISWVRENRLPSPNQLNGGTQIAPSLITDFTLSTIQDHRRSKGTQEPKHFEDFVVTSTRTYKNLRLNRFTDG